MTLSQTNSARHVGYRPGTGVSGYALPAARRGAGPDRARAHQTHGSGGAGGTFQARVERDITAAEQARRLAQLNAVEHGLCFGRTDAEPDRRPRGHAVHRPDRPAGRRARAAAHRLARSRGPPLLRRHPQGPERPDPPPPHLHQEPHRHRGRRRGLRPGPAVRAGPPEPVRRGHADRQHHQPPHRPDERRGGHHPGRAGPGHPSALQGVLVVQGGPGTGKTVAALHRAAYLLYTHRRTLERRGVLVIGPNATFLRYISQVLPSLGETDVVLSSIAELFPGVKAAPDDDPEAAVVKGDVTDGERAAPRGAQPAAGAAGRPGDHRGRRGDDGAARGRAARPGPGPRRCASRTTWPASCSSPSCSARSPPPRRGRSAASSTPRTSRTRAPGCGTSRRSGPRSTGCGRS